MKEQRFIDTKELSELLKVNEETARRLCRNGRLTEAGITVIKTGQGRNSHYRISASDIKAKIGKKGVLTAEEAAIRLSVNHRTIKRMCLDGRLKHLKIGSSRPLWRVSVQALEELGQ